MGDLTATQLAAAAADILLANGYSEAASVAGPGRFYEDAFGIVAVYVFKSWPALHEGWPQAQGELVDLMSAHLRLPEPKAWEGYLVLLTPDLLGTEGRVRLTELRGDTQRVRKLVATGEDLRSLGDVRAALLPLLPLDVEGAGVKASGVLEQLPALMVSEGIPTSVTIAVLDAFQANESILGQLHELGGKK